jgi:hypothetical protein
MPTITELTEYGAEPQGNELIAIETLEKGTRKTTYKNFQAPMQRQISALAGVGGYLPENDFTTATPTQEQLTQYAAESIWGEGGTFMWNATTPSSSTYVAPDGVTHTAVEIFNSTKVKNTNNSHTWILTNTPSTTPPVFDWSDNGIDEVGYANETTAGVAKLYTSLGNNTDGAVDQNTITNELSKITGMPIGAVISVARTDIPSGYVRLDGTEIPTTLNNDFYVNYLLSGKIPNRPIADWHTAYAANNGNVGFWGIDIDNGILKAPIIDDRATIMQCLTLGNIGQYGQDQIVNITGDTGEMPSGGTPTGAFFTGTGLGGSGNNHFTNQDVFKFDASRVVNTGDRVQPRHIQYPLVMAISNQAVQASEAQYNEFITGLNSRANIDLDNISDSGKNAIQTFRDIDYKNGILKTWNTKYQAANTVEVYIYSSFGTTTSKLLMWDDNNNPIQYIPSPADTSYSAEFLGAAINSQSGYFIFHMQIPKGYYYQAVGGLDGYAKRVVEYPYQ